MIRSRLAILALAVAASLLVACGTWSFGIGLSPDSVRFVSLARNLVTGNDHFVGSNLSPLWPPLFMVVLAAPGVFGVDPLVTAGVLNPVIPGLICLVAGLWFHRTTRAPHASVAVAAVIAFAIPLAQVASFVWTDPLFILLTVLSLFYVVRSIEEDSPRRLYLAAALAALACLTRYAGVALVASTLLALLVAGRRTLPQTIRRMAAYAAIAAVPLGLWLLRNWLLTATLTGNRSPPEESPVVYHLIRTVGTLGVWAVPWARGAAERVADLLRVWEPHVDGAVAVLVVFAGMALAALASARLARRGLRDMPARLGVTSPFFGVLICYASVYVVFLVTAASTVLIGEIGDRLLAPVFVPVVLAAALVATRLAKELAKPPSGRLGRWLAWAGAAYVAAYIACYPPELTRAVREGHGFNARVWRESALIAWLNDAGAVSLRSNVPDLLYLHVPEATRKPLPGGVRGLARMISSPAAAGDSVVWFHGTAYSYDLPEIAAELGLRREREFPEGVVFTVPGPPASRGSP